MVGLVIVSHSDSLAKSVVELTKIMASNAQIVSEALAPALRKSRLRLNLFIPTTECWYSWIWAALS